MREDNKTGNLTNYIYPSFFIFLHLHFPTRMSTKVLVLSPSKQRGRSGQRSSDGITNNEAHYYHHQHHHHETPTTNNDGSSNSIIEMSPPNGRDGLHSFLHRELRISSDTSDIYCNALIENGYDDVASLQDATEHDLKEMGVKIGHVRRIKRAVFSNCMRSERRSFGGSGGSCSTVSQRLSELHVPFASSPPNDHAPTSDEPASQIVVSSGSNSRTPTSIEGALLSDYARQEMINYTPSSRERNVDLDLASAKELLIRKQAEKIASLEAKLANVGINTSFLGGGGEISDLQQQYDDVLSSSRHISSRGSRAGSADTSHSKKLTPEERLEQHKQRKLRENKYKEKTGVWDRPPPKKKEKNLTQKVAENDDLVLKLTSDPTQRKKIEEVEKKTKRAAKKSFSGDDDAMQMSPPSNNNNTISYSSSRRSSNSRGDGSVSFSPDTRQQQQHHKRKVCCDTCGSLCDCEPDVDNPGVYYCKSCWEEYEEDVDQESQVIVQSPSAQSPAVVYQTSQTTLIEEEEDEDPTHHALWIAHDNPQLGENVIYSGPRRMECMLETKEPGKKNCVRIIIGDIDFNGEVKHAGIGNRSGRENDVGTECIRIRNVKGYYVDQNQAASRLSRDKSIYEFHLGDENAHLLTGHSASMSVEEFFKGCNGAIDVILDPQRDGGWYPQREAMSGGRKIAPQFRSKGVGYIRLGDDMSENGRAFLSSNACLTFLSSVSSNSGSKKTVAAAPPSYKPTSVAKPNAEKRDSSTVSRGKSTSFRRQPPPPPESDESDDGSSSDDDESVEEVQKISDVLKQLQSPDMQANMKWKDKAELLSQLGKGASREDGRSSRAAALNVIQDTLGAKNVNVHVLRSSLIAAGMVGVSMGAELVTQNSWKTIMIETLKLLKSKQCGSVAKTVLAQLHGRCFKLSNSMECVSHVLGVGLAASASKSRKSSMRHVMESPKPRKTTASSGNNIEVIEWLAETTERERNMEVIDPMLDRNGLSMLINLFFSHADHRDQRCRKNVLDGLMHCALYAVQRLELDLTRVMRMCSGLKETNPRGWNQVFTNVKVVLEEER